MPVVCPHCQTRFPHSDQINSRHKATCAGWQAALGERSVPPCLCGHIATSMTQMKRHRAQCSVWKARHRGTVQMQRLAETLQKNHGVGVTHPTRIPEAEARRRQTNLERYGAVNCFSRGSSVYSKVREASDLKRVYHRGSSNTFARSEIKARIQSTLLSRYGVTNPQQVLAVRLKTQNTNLQRYGAPSPLSSPLVRERIKATNLVRYGGPAPACSEEVLDRTRATNRSRWGFDWTNQNPDVRQRQAEAQFEHYGTWFLASEEGKAKVRQALIDKYGVDHPAKIEGYWSKMVQTFVKRYGVQHPFLLAEFLEKRRETCLERYGVDNPMQSPEVYQRAAAAYASTCLQRYGVPNAMKDRVIALRALEAAKRIGPNMLERQFGRQNPELLYTGNGTFWRLLPLLGHHKNPDFILPGPDPAHPRRGVKKVIELFGDYWHSRLFTGKANFEHVQELIDAWKVIGIDCLIIWESEFKADPSATRLRLLSHLTGGR